MADIKVAHVSKSYRLADGGRGATVLDDFSLEVPDHGFICLLGPSGCGKSTFLNLLSGLDRDYQGSILVGGADHHKNPARVGYVFQEPRLLPWLTASGNMEFALRNCRIPREQWPGLIDEHLTLVGLGKYREFYPHQMSGGMRQRLALARALSVSPDVLLMDEPFSGLDELTARRIRVDLLRIWRAKRKTVVFVTHNAYEASFLADRILVMAKGRVRETFEVDVPRPRDYDDPRVFEVNRRVVKTFLEVAGDQEEPVPPTP